MLFRKTTIAYGIAELLRKTRSSPISPDVQCKIDNYVVQTKQPTRADIVGVDMLLPRLSVVIVEPSYLWEGYDDDRQEMGRYFEVKFPSLPEADGAAVFFSQSEESDRCHSYLITLIQNILHLPTNIG